MKQNLAETLEARSFHILATVTGFLVSSSCLEALLSQTSL